MPFEALIKDGKYLIEQKDIRYIPSGKELVRLYRYRKDTTGANTVALFANPKFDDATIAKESKKEDISITPNTRAGIVKSLFKMRFSNLPGTKEEAKIVKETLQKDKVNIKDFEEEKANEENLMHIKNPKILHIATHGFFIDDTTVPNPMLKSGIALSGANAGAVYGNGAGIVTALKLSGMKLRGTDLVVLSACETGVVDVNSTDAVSGLSKAFIQAGTKDVIMSLWSVNDKATKNLMESFYKEQRVNKNYVKSLKEAKLRMIHENLHPYFWAPFVISGM
jgi:CHAT domain-containing protein